MLDFRKIGAVLGALTFSCPAHGASTINTAVPAAGAPFQSTPIRNNFLAAANAGISLGTTAAGCALRGAGATQEFTGAFGSQTAPTKGTILYQTSGTNCAITVTGNQNGTRISDLAFRTLQPADGARPARSALSYPSPLCYPKCREQGLSQSVDRR